MIIVSQNKKEVFNVNNISRLYIDIWISEEFTTEPNCWCIKAEKAQDDLRWAFLGEYETEERAKEVLEQITIAYANMEIIKIPCIRIEETLLAKELKRNIVFEMPEK